MALGEAQVACTNNAPGPTKAGLFVVRQTITNFCFVDEDRDGKFDQGFPWAGGNMQMVYVPKKRQTITAFSATKTDPKLSGISKSLYLQYGGLGPLGGSLTFQLCFEKDNRIQNNGRYVYHGGCLAPEIRAKREPSEFDVLGSRFAVDAKVDSRLHIKQLTSIPTQTLLIN